MQRAQMEDYNMAAVAKGHLDEILQSFPLAGMKRMLQVDGNNRKRGQPL